MKPNLTLTLLIAACFSGLMFSIPAKAQVNSTTPNNYFSNSTYQFFEVPTATDVTQLGFSNLQVVVSTIPVPTINWDDNNGNTGGLTVTTFGTNTVFLDDVILTKPVSGAGPVAVITCREFLTNNTVNIRLLIAAWTGSAFVLQSNMLLDNRTNNSDWFDRVSISTHENGAELSNRQELFVTWQEAGRIWVSEGYIYFSTNTISFYNTKLDVFPGLLGVFKHPDVSRKTTTYKTIAAVQTTGSSQNMLSFDYTNTELNPTPVPATAPVYRLWYIYANPPGTEIVMPRTEKAYNEYSLITATLVDHLQQMSILGIFGDIGKYNASSINKGFEQNCFNNTNYKKTGYPAIAVTQNSSGVYDFEVVWQQIFCNPPDFCTVQVLSRRYQYEPSTGAFVPGQYFHINNDLNRNSCFPSIASLPASCLNFYAFDMMDKNTSFNGQVAYKSSLCNGATVKTGGSLSRGSSSDGDTRSPVPAETNNLPNVYPNPVSDWLYADLSKEKGTFKAELVDAYGTVVKKVMVQGGNIVRIDVRGVGNSIYYLRISSATRRVLTQKITVIH